ncbi:MAG: hypothetical protein WD768_09320 [Phycisphaeraceae bacterium]
MPLVAFISEFFNFDRYVNLGVDAAIYFIIAMTATLLFLVRLGLQLFFGLGDDDMAIGGDVDVSHAGHMDSTGAFTLFSLLSILAFLMGTGWMGLTCRVSWGWGPVPTSFAASGFGFFLMMLSAGLMYGVRKMAKEAKYDVATAIGKTGRVYLTIPEKGKGRGQVEVVVSGRKKILTASSTGESIAAFTTVTIVSMEDDHSLVVEVKA